MAMTYFVHQNLDDLTPNTPPFGPVQNFPLIAYGSDAEVPEHRAREWRTTSSVARTVCAKCAVCIPEFRNAGVFILRIFAAALEVQPPSDGVKKTRRPSPFGVPLVSRCLQIFTAYLRTQRILRLSDFQGGISWVLLLGERML